MPFQKPSIFAGFASVNSIYSQNNKETSALIASAVLRQNNDFNMKTGNKCVIKELLKGQLYEI